MQNTLRIHKSRTIERIAFLVIALAVITLASIFVQHAKADTLGISITPTGPLNLDVGQNVTLAAHPSGGTGNYTTYQWYVNGGAVSGATDSAYEYAPSSVSSVSITVTVTDSSPDTSDPSPPISVVVNSALSSPSAFTGTTPIERGGQSSTISITGLSGGTTPYNYQWLIEAPGAGSYSIIVGATSDTYAFSTTTSTTLGIWSFEVQVTDSASNPVIATSSATVVAVIAGPTTTVLPTSWTMDVGQIETFTATPAGGSGSYLTYQWYVDGVVQTGQTAAAFSYSALSPGSPLITVTVTDSNSATSSQSSAPSVKVNAAPTVSISPFGPLTLGAGQALLCTATPSGGSGAIHYHWYMYHWYVGATTFDNDSNTYSFSESGGLYSVTCTVTDSASVPVNSSASNSISITVNAAALNTPIAEASAVSINRGQNSKLSATGLSGGITPYHYQWLSEAPGAGSYSAVSGATSSTYLFSATGATNCGTWHFELQVMDSADIPATVTSSTATVEVCPLISFATNAAVTSDASGTVLLIDTMPYTYGDLQTFQFSNWKIGSTHTITATTKISVIGGLKQYVFHDWTNGNGLVTATGTFTTPSADTTVTVNYTPQYQIAVTAPSNGQITPGATAFYDAGISQEFSINASSGYYISDVIIDGSSVGTSNSYVFNSISTHHTISASFAPNSPSPTPQPTPSSSPSPSITPSPTATPVPTFSPTPQPTASSNITPALQQTPVSTLTPTPPPTSAPIAKPTQTPTQNPTIVPAETPSVVPTTTASPSTSKQNPSSNPTAVPTTTPHKRADPSTSGILTGEMAAMLAFIVAILVIVVLVFKKSKR